MATLLRAGKFLFIVPFLAFGVMHLMSGADMAGMVPIPGGAIWVYVTGLAHLAAVVAILIGKLDQLATFLLGIMLIIFVLTIHLPGTMNSEGMEQMSSMSSLLKDIGLAGGAWMYALGLAKDRTVTGGDRTLVS